MSTISSKKYVISGITWTIDKEFHFGIENAKYIETLINDVKYLPIEYGEILFTDNKWDFRPYYRYKKSNTSVFSFSKIPKEYLIISKFFVLLTMLNSENSLSTLNRRLSDIKRFLTYLKTLNIISLDYVYTDTIINFLNANTNHSAQTKSMTYIAIEDFFKFVKANYSYKLNIDFSIFDEKSKYYEISRQTRDNKKTPNIPREYYNKLLSLLLKSMRDSNLPYKYRSIACIYVILSQTGLRIEEILSLETNSIKSIKLKNIDSIAYYFDYKDFKSSNSDSEFIIGKIFVNELTKEAFETLVELRKNRPNSINNEFIYIPDTKHLPASHNFSRSNFLSFLYNYAEFAKGDTSPYDQLSVVNNYGNSVIAPTTKQFRVHVCTELYERNVPLLYIQKYMTHLSDDMQGYYVRPKTQKQEDVEYSNKLLKEIITNQALLLGNDSKQIKENIDNFIKENNFRIEKDLDTIIESLSGKFVIRCKRGGVCVKTSIRECSQDARTNEMLCAYNLCPNLFHLYYMADTSYEDFISTQKTFEYNKKHGFKLQASKELNKIKHICTKRLEPEMEDLKRRISAKGINEILENYPELSDIVNNFDNIMEEIDLWKKKKF